MFVPVLIVGTIRALHSECVPSHSFTLKPLSRHYQTWHKKDRLLRFTHSLIHASFCVQLTKLQPAQVGAGWSPINWIMIRLYALFNFNYSYSFIISRFCFVFVDTCLSEFLTCGTPYYFIVTIILTFIITQ